MGHGVGNQAHVQLLGDLLHDCGLADAGRADHEDRALALDGDDVVSELVLGKIGRDGVFNLFLRFFDVHGKPPVYSL